MMKNLMFIVIICLISCKSKLQNDIVIKKNFTNYRIFFEDNKTDSLAIHFPCSYILKNESNEAVNLKFIKSKPKSFLNGDFTINEKGELDILLNQKIMSGDSLNIIFFVSKVYSKKDMQQYQPFENFKDYILNFKNIDRNKQQVLSNISIKEYLKEVEKDTIYFEFINREKNIHFYKVGIIEGKEFFTDDKSNK